MELHRRAATCRPASMGGVMPIPDPALRDILDDSGIGANEWLMVERLVRKVDDWIVDWHENKPKPAKASKSPSSQRSAPRRGR